MGIPKHIREKLGIPDDQNCHDIMLEETKKKWPDFVIDPELHAASKESNNRIGQLAVEDYGKLSAGLNSMKFPIKNNKEEMKNLLKPWLTAFTLHTDQDFDREWQIILNMASDDSKMEPHTHSIDTNLLRQNKQQITSTHAFKDIEQMIREFDAYDFIELEVISRKNLKDLDTLASFFGPLKMTGDLAKKVSSFHGAAQKAKMSVNDLKEIQQKFLNFIRELKKEP